MKKFALISGLLFLVVYFWVNTLTKEESSFDVEYPLVKATTLTNGESSPASEPPRVNENTLSSTDATGTSSEAESPRTYIILASFGDLEHARMTAEAYTAKYKTEILVLPPTPDGNYRISYGSYPSSGEAKDALGKIREAGFPDAWILSPW